MTLMIAKARSSCIMIPAPPYRECRIYPRSKGCDAAIASYRHGRLAERHSSWARFDISGFKVMRAQLRILCRFSTVLIALHCTSTYAYNALDRWDRTATNITTGVEGSPITVTWSFATDGTVIPEGTSSQLLNFLDSHFGSGLGGNDLSQRPWFPIFQQSFARLSALSGVDFVYEPSDDGLSFSNAAGAWGELSIRGDIRLGGKSFGINSNTLAFTYLPEYGEMMINTDQQTFLTTSDNNYRGFRNTLMHEAMHALGFDHVASNDAAFLLEPLIKTFFDGPQLDDVLGIQRLYGDAREKSGGNDSYSNATPLGIVTPSQPVSIGTLGGGTQVMFDQTDFVSIDDDSDTDFFSFSITSRQAVTLQLMPRGTAYLAGQVGGTQLTVNSLALSNLALGLFGSDGASNVALADNNPAGTAEEIIQQLLPGTYYVRVTGNQNAIQLYQLNVSAEVPVPGDYDNDGVVDAADYIVWRGTLNQTGTHLAADGNANGVVDGGDYNEWRNHFGQSSSDNSAATAVDQIPAEVPEPSSCAILVIGIFVAVVTRQKRRMHAATSTMSLDSGIGCLL